MKWLKHIHMNEISKLPVDLIPDSNPEVSARGPRADNNNE